MDNTTGALMEQEFLTLLENKSSPPVLVGFMLLGLSFLSSVLWTIVCLLSFFFWLLYCLFFFHLHLLYLLLCLLSSNLYFNLRHKKPIYDYYNNDLTDSEYINNFTTNETEYLYISDNSWRLFSNINKIVIRFHFNEECSTKLNRPYKYLVVNCMCFLYFNAILSSLNTYYQLKIFQANRWLLNVFISLRASRHVPYSRGWVPNPSREHGFTLLLFVFTFYLYYFCLFLFLFLFCILSVILLDDPVKL